MTTAAPEERSHTDVPAVAAVREPCSQSLTGRLGLTLVFVLIFSVGLSALLAYFNFEKRHKELISSRLQVMLDEIRIGIDYGTGLGLTLSSLTETGGQLQMLVERDTAIESALVLSALRQPVFQSGQADIIPALPDDWFQHTTAGQDGNGHVLTHETAQYLLVAEPLFNSFHVQSGLVVLAYSRAAYQAKEVALLKAQSVQSLAVIVLSAIAGLGLLWLMMRRLRQQILRLSGHLEARLQGDTGIDADTAIGSNTNSRTTASDAGPSSPDELDARFLLLQARVQEARKESAANKTS